MGFPGVHKGQRAQVKVESFPDQTLRAHVESVSTVAAAADFLSADVKVYSTKIAIDKANGQNRWRVDRPRGINWVSPIVIPNGSQTEVLFHGPSGIDAHDVATGTKKWTSAKPRALSLVHCHIC